MGRHHGMRPLPEAGTAFPNAEVPSPYIEPLHEASLSPDSRDLSNYENCLRRELPLMVRSEIEEAIREESEPQRDSLVENLVGIIQDCQDRIFRAYRLGLDVEDNLDLTITSASVARTEFDSPKRHVAQSQTAPDRPDETHFLDAIFHPPPPVQDPGAFSERFAIQNQTWSFSLATKFSRILVMPVKGSAAKMMLAAALEQPYARLLLLILLRELTSRE